MEEEEEGVQRRETATNGTAHAAAAKANVDAHTVAPNHAPLKWQGAAAGLHHQKGGAFPHLDPLATKTVRTDHRKQTDTKEVNHRKPFTAARGKEGT